MFGIPFNVIPNVKCKANIFSVGGTRDVMFQTIQFEGVTGRDFSDKAIPPNRGFLLYRVEIEGIAAYYQYLMSQNINIHKPLQEIIIEPYGSCQSFALFDPDGVWWSFYESKNQ